MEDLDLLFNGRIADRRRLQSVPQRLVIQQDLARRYHRPGVDGVPVVDKISNFGSHFAFDTPSSTPTSAKSALVGEPRFGAPPRRPTRRDAGHGPLRFRLSPKCRLLLSFFFARLGLQSQSKNGLLAQTSNILVSRLLFARQVQRLAVLTTIDFRLVAKALAHIATGLLQHIGQIEPALQMSAAELALCVRLVTGALERLLIFHLMFGKLRGFSLHGLRHKGSIACCEEYLNTLCAATVIFATEPQEYWSELQRVGRVKLQNVDEFLVRAHGSQSQTQRKLRCGRECCGKHARRRIQFARQSGGLLPVVGSPSQKDK